jgi:hypothetical protein
MNKETAMISEDRYKQLKPRLNAILMNPAWPCRLTRDDARDLLALLEQDRDADGQKKSPVTEVLSALGEIDSAWDDGVCECLDQDECTCKKDTPMKIAFKPWKPTLDQMPEEEEHVCEHPGTGRKCVLFHGCGYVFEPSAKDGIRDLCMGRKPSDFTVLDADPPMPKTVADLPAWVWGEGEDGEVVWRDSADRCYVLARQGHARVMMDVEPANCLITRVLGTPYLEAE